MSNSSALVQKVWNICHTLRDDGVSFGDYLEQLTYLLFLKMADEYAAAPYFRETQIPAPCNWNSLRGKTGAALEAHYIEVLRTLGEESGLLGEIFFKAHNKIQDRAKLSRLIALIDAESWVSLETDVKGDIYEGLLEKNAEDTKSGAGQYFTPRPLIRAMVECLRPEPLKTIADPACGTGGFFLSAYDFISQRNLSIEEKKFLKFNTFYGWEIVPSTVRLALMNLYLHNIGDMNSEPPIMRADSLLERPSKSFDFVFANPPFGKKSSITVTNDKGFEKKKTQVYNRQDFWTTTSNKQLNFVQHIRSILKVDGKAAVVVPDNVLFEGGAGETVRLELLKNTDLHTILRLPTGIFYAQGVKANVLFFDNKPASNEMQTKEVWYYDLRTNQNFSLKTRKMSESDLEDFVKSYQPENRFKREETERFKRFSCVELLKREKTSLDIFWLKDERLSDMDNLPEPDALAASIIEGLEEALAEFRSIQED